MPAFRSRAAPVAAFHILQCEDAKLATKSQTNEHPEKFHSGFFDIAMCSAAVPCQNFVRAENIDIAGISGQASDS